MGNALADYVGTMMALAFVAGMATGAALTFVIPYLWNHISITLT